MHEAVLVGLKLDRGYLNTHAEPRRKQELNRRMFANVCLPTVQSQFSKQSDLNSVHLLGLKLWRKHFSVSTKPSKSIKAPPSLFWKELTNESARMNLAWNAPISDRFSSLCARVFSPAAAILESEKTLGTRLVNTSKAKWRIPRKCRGILFHLSYIIVFNGS